MARPPIRLRNSWNSSCPSELRSNLFIMRSRTPGSFWFFVKAPSSVFMKIRNSALESLLLLPSLPARFWKTAIRDSMHHSVFVGLDTFAMSERSEVRGCEWGAAWLSLGGRHQIAVPFFVAFMHAQSLQLCPTLCDPMNCSPPSSSTHGILKARILEWVCRILLQGIFPTQGQNVRLLCFLHCRQILCH